MEVWITAESRTGARAVAPGHTATVAKIQACHVTWDAVLVRPPALRTLCLSSRPLHLKVSYVPPRAVGFNLR